VVVTGKITPTGIVVDGVLLELGGAVGEKVNSDPSPFVTVIGVVTAGGIVNSSPELEITVSPAGSVVVIASGGLDETGLELSGGGDTVGKNVKIEPSPFVTVIGVVTAGGIVNSSPELEITVSPAGSVVVTASGGPGDEIWLELSGGGETVGKNVKIEPSPLVSVIGVVIAVGIVNCSPELDITVSPAVSVVVRMPGKLDEPVASVVGWKVTTELSGKVTTLAVEISLGRVTAPEVSEITVCPREFVVVTTPGIVVGGDEDPGAVADV
jgi:hypothetical protein